MVFEPSYTSILSIYITDVKVAKKYGEKLQKNTFRQEFLPM